MFPFDHEICSKLNPVPAVPDFNVGVCVFHKQLWSIRTIDTEISGGKEFCLQTKSPNYSYLSSWVVVVEVLRMLQGAFDILMYTKVVFSCSLSDLDAEVGRKP